MITGEEGEKEALDTCSVTSVEGCTRGAFGVPVYSTLLTHILRVATS